MAIFNGNIGLISTGTFVILNSSKWSFSDDRDTEDYARFADYNATGGAVIGHTVVGGHNISNGQCEGMLDSTAATMITLGSVANSIVSDALAFTLKLTTGYTCVFTGFFTAFDVVIEAGKASRWTGSFESSLGDIVWA